MAETTGKRTAVYIDGYNLYYGRLRGTLFKWLDVVALFENVLRIQDPNSTLTKLRYFTAPALGKFAGHGQASTEAQENYHRALLARYPGLFELKLGQYSFARDGVNMPMYVAGEPYDRKRTARVWHLVEKMTDVNLAMAMYRDARSGAFEQLVLCSNDSDATPALEAIREDFPNIVIGVVAPVRPPEHDKSRRTSSSLSAVADWNRQYLMDDELAHAQLPSSVPTKKKPAVKPAHW